jgi:hypothetical protein
LKKKKIKSFNPIIFKNVRRNTGVNIFDLIDKIMSKLIGTID